MRQGSGWFVSTIVVVLICAAIALGVYWSQWRPQPVLQPNDDRRAAESASERTLASRELPILAHWPAVAGNSAGEAPFSTDQLLGRAWLAQQLESDAAAAADSGPALFAQLKAEIENGGLARDVRLVSFVPAGSTLADAQQRIGADGQIWRVLQPSADQVTALQKAFGNNTHAILLVDPQGDIRGQYDPPRAADISALLNDLQLTLDERVMLLNTRLETRLPNDLVEPAWLPRRQQSQIDGAASIRPYHDFSYSDRRQESGIQFRHRIVDDAGRSFVTAHYDHGNGLSVADVNGDGFLDIYFVNQVGGNQLWKNNGDGTFENITERAGVAVRDRIGVSAAFADIDNDGDADLYVTTVRGGNLLFQNDGQGIFQDITAAAGLNYSGHSSGAVFFDYNRDGKLDLLVVNVGKYTTEQKLTVVNDRVTGGDGERFTYYASNPDAFAAHLKPERGERSILYRNAGQNQFEDVSEETKLLDANWTGDATAADLNADGWPDLYFVNMQGHDEYYENIGGQYFERKSRQLFPATPWGSMGVKAFDYDNDGDLDLYVTDMHTDMAQDLSPANEDQKVPQDAVDPDMLATDGNHVLGNAFFVNEGDEKFAEKSDALHVENYWPWGFSVGDLNADGFDDIFVTASMSFPFRYTPNRVLLNDSGRDFHSSEFVLGVEPRRDNRTATPWFELENQGADLGHPISKLLAGKNILVRRAVVWGALGSRSSAIFDIENDGDLDIVTNDFNAPPMVLISNLSQRQPDLHYLKVSLAGRGSNRDGLGAAVRLKSGGATFMKVNDGKSGYLSHSRLPLYFGLGDHAVVDEVEVTWPSGKQQILAGPIEVNTTLAIEETAIEESSKRE